jgi:hypothetical protein
LAGLSVLLLVRLLVLVTFLLIASCGAALQKDFYVAWDTMKVSQEVRETTEAEARKISLAYDGAIAAQIQAETSVKERSTELQGLRQLMGEVCNRLSPPPSLPRCLWLSGFGRFLGTWCGWSLKACTSGAA